MAVAQGAQVLEMAALRGITEYVPDEFTFTARAGTSLAEIDAALKEHGQFLPFDPPLVETGATLGGAIASGLSGSGRVRYGGLRDFLLGVAFVDGQGRLVRGGGKVVKNAAGIDMARLMIGSLGRLGVLVEATFKVFPRPQRYATVRLRCRDMREVRAAIAKLYTSPIELYGLEVSVDGPPALWVRIGGLDSVRAERLQRLLEILPGAVELSDSEELEFWRRQREFGWVERGWNLVRSPIAVNVVESVDRHFQAAGAKRVYSAGATQAWFSLPATAEEPGPLLSALGLGGLVVWGESEHPLVGVRTGDVMLQRVKRVLDPDGRFLEF
jgi:glycolate oxidase FAD binding subunit